MTFRLPFIGPQKTAPAREEDIGSKSTNLALFASLGPFTSTDRPQVRRLPAALNSLVVLPLNLCLFTNPIPFKQTDWAPVKPSVRRATQHVQTPLNLCLYTNPIPNKQKDWPQVDAVPRQTSQPQPYNLALLSSGTVTAPFSQTDWSKVSAVKFSLPAPQPNTLVNLLAQPLNGPDLSTSKFPRSSVDATRQTNVNLFTNPIPFSQTDWAPAKETPRLLTTPDATAPANINLYPPVVVVGTEKLRAPYLSKPFPREPNPSDVTWPNIALANPVVGPAPFAQLDWPKVAPPRIASLDQSNNVLFDGSVPFNKLDWTIPRFPVPKAPDQQAYNLALLTTVVVQAPFYQTDWPLARRVKPQSVDITLDLNPSLYTNPIPFAQYDWSKTTFQAPRAPDQQNYNLALSFVFVQPPFAQLDWSTTKFQTPRLPDASVRLNPNLYTNPIPFAQLDWSKTIFQNPRLPDPSVQPNLALNPPPQPPPPEFSVAPSPDNSAPGDIVKRKKKKKKFVEDKTSPPTIRRAVYERIIEKHEAEKVEDALEEVKEEVEAKAEPFKGSLIDLAPPDAKAALKRKQQEEEEIALILLGFK